MAEPNDVTRDRLLHDLAFLYFTMAYGADGDLDEKELQEITKKLKERYPDLSDDALESSSAAAFESFLEADKPMEEAESAVQVVRDKLPEAGRRLVYEDLKGVAEADGVVLDEEKELLSILAEGWGIS